MLNFFFALWMCFQNSNSGHVSFIRGTTSQYKNTNYHFIIVPICLKFCWHLLGIVEEPESARKFEHIFWRIINFFLHCVPLKGSSIFCVCFFEIFFNFLQVTNRRSICICSVHSFIFVLLCQYFYVGMRAINDPSGFQREMSRNLCLQICIHTCMAFQSTELLAENHWLRNRGKDYEKWCGIVASAVQCVYFRVMQFDLLTVSYHLHFVIHVAIELLPLDSI